MERVLQGHRVLGRKPPSPGCAWLPGSLEVTWEDAGVTQTLAAGGMTSPGTAKHARCGRGRSFTSPLCREHHKPRISRMWRGQGDYMHITRKDKEREIFFSVHPTVESLNDKIENLQNREMVLLFYVFLWLIKSSIFFPLENTVTIQISLRCCCHPPWADKRCCLSWKCSRHEGWFCRYLHRCPQFSWCTGSKHGNDGRQFERLSPPLQRAVLKQAHRGCPTKSLPPTWKKSWMSV